MKNEGHDDWKARRIICQTTKPFEKLARLAIGDTLANRFYRVQEAEAQTKTQRFGILRSKLPPDILSDLVLQT